MTGDVAGHPVWNLRAKTPQQEQATVPWHQVLHCSSHKTRNQMSAFGARIHPLIA